MNRFLYLAGGVGLFLSLTQLSHASGYVIRPLATSNIVLNNVRLNNDINLSFELQASRNGTGSPICTSDSVQGAVFHMVYWLDNITVAGEPVSVTSVSKKINEANFSLTTVASEINGNSVVVVGRRDDPTSSPGACTSATASSLRLQAEQMSLSSVLPAGRHKVNFNFTMMRILAHNTMTPEEILNLAKVHKGSSVSAVAEGYIDIASYCTDITTQPLLLEHGNIDMNKINNHSVSKSISYKCNTTTILPKVTLSASNIDICTGVVSNVTSNTEFTEGRFGIKTTFKSTLKESGNIDSSCAGAFEKSLIATINMP